MLLERIKQFIDYKGIAISVFEKSIGMSNASFGKSLKTGGTIGGDKLENILTVYPELNPVWLMTGKGGMLKESEDPAAEKPQLVAEHIPQLSNVEILLRELLAEKEAKIDALQGRINELIEENARLKTLLEQKGGNAPDAEHFSSADAV